MKKVNLLSALMLIVMATLLPQKSHAQSFYQVCSTGQFLHYEIINSSEVLITGGDCLTGDLIIPDTVSYYGNEYTITSIYNNAFTNSDLTSVYIPNTVSSIGERVFQDCISLTSVNIPNSVTSIGLFAFRGCSGLTSVYIPSSVETIDGNIFSNCSNLTSISVDIDNLMYDSRNNCNAIIDKSNNKLITGCQNTIIPNSVTSIGDNVFENCSSLTSINIPNSVTTIGSIAFAGCSGLTSVTIPNSVTFISSGAFENCSNLTSINIPRSVIMLNGGNNVFRGCSSLNTITVDANNPVYDSRNNCNAIIRKSNNELVAGCQNTVIPNSVTSIGHHAFSGCSGLTSINIPNSVTSISYNAFENCSGLISINIPNSVTSIGGSVFKGCNNLTSVSLPTSITSIEDNAFESCNNLTSLNIPSSITNIGTYAFLNCNSLTSINIPNSVTDISWGIFQGCYNLTIITVNANNQVFDSRNNCNAIIRKSDNTLIAGCQNSIIPNSVTSIGHSAFKGCSGLTSVNIPHSVTSIGPGAFSGCSNLVSINIPSTVSFIGAQAFSDCSSLSSITIPNSITTIGQRTFYNCSNLTTIDIPNSITTIESGAFYNCSSLATINIPNSVTSISSAFYGCSGLVSISVDTNNTVYDSRDNCNAIIRSWSNTLIVGCQSTVIPSSVTSIANRSFYNCFSSGSLTSLANTPPALDGGICSIFGNTSDDFKVFIPCGTKDDYMAAWSSDINFKGFEDYDTSFTVTTTDSCYTWNSQTYCASGDYTQTLQTIHGCDSVVTLHLTITVGVDNYDGFDFKVYPNPTSNIVNVECIMKNEQWGEVELHLCDAYGRLLGVVETQNFASLQTAQIDLSRYANGIYFVKTVANGKTVAVRKVVKQ